MKKNDVALRCAACRLSHGLDDVRHQAASTGVNAKSMGLVRNGERQRQAQAAKSDANNGAKRFIRFHEKRPARKRLAPPVRDKLAFQLTPGLIFAWAFMEFL